MSRRVGDLLWARWATKAPFGQLRGRSHAQKAGIRFEKAFGKALKEMPLDYTWKAGPWIEFEDCNGKGYAQPDHVGISPAHILLVECKLSHCQEGYDQLELLYGPLLRFIYPHTPLSMIQVCRSAWSPRTGTLGREISCDFLHLARSRPTSVSAAQYL